MNTADAVTAAGGLIFDRVATGWEVEVHLAERGDIRALNILGVTARQGFSGFDTHGKLPDAIMVSVALYRQDIAIRKRFALETLRDRTELGVWGGEWPTDLAPGFGRVEHRLSTAARVFKTHAMAAAGMPSNVTESEVFRTGRRRLTIAVPLVPSK